MRYAHPNGDCLNIEKHEKDEKKRGDALRAEPTNGPTHEREENHARMSYPERKGGR